MALAPSLKRRTSLVVGGAAVAALGFSSILVAGPAAAAGAATVSDTTATPTPTTTTPTPKPAPKLPKPVYVDATITPAANALVGVGYPITAQFSTTVHRRGVAESHLRVYLNGHPSKGAWYWKDGRTAIYRQSGVWPGHARIEVRMSLRGVSLSSSATENLVGGPHSTRVQQFRTARSFVASVNAKTDRMIVRIDGKIVKDFGVSLGKPGFDTRSGIKTTMDKYLVRHMTSAQLGLTDPKDFYDLMAPYATRVTYSGEFVHGAPWAMGRIGKWNGSHGCTNVSVANAKWFYDNTLVGDVVITTGTPITMEYWNSLGAVYNMPWKQWLAGSALKGK